uniref:Uncharacterized protein n=1 Tax=viral metagenome TaxID=1070528 RepID=A0A6C0CKY3_9ZZZZ
MTVYNTINTLNISSLVFAIVFWVLYFIKTSKLAKCADMECSKDGKFMLWMGVIFVIVSLIISIIIYSITPRF